MDVERVVSLFMAVEEEAGRNVEVEWYVHDMWDKTGGRSFCPPRRKKFDVTRSNFDTIQELHF